MEAAGWAKEVGLVRATAGGWATEMGLERSCLHRCRLH